MAEKLIEGEDYVMERGLLVFTRAYHLKRGYCCKSGCRHCPFGFDRSSSPEDAAPDQSSDQTSDDSGEGRA